MVPSAVTVENFRAYGRAERFELKPLTLIFGRNNSGKSALMRLLPMIGDSLQSDRLDALTLDQRLAHWDFSFRNLRHYGLQPEDDPTIGITLEFADAPVERIEWRLTEPPDWNRIVVQNMKITHGGSTTEIEWRGGHDDERLDSELTYKIAEADPKKVAFRGLSPAFDFTEDSALNRSVRDMKMHVVWLHALRHVPEREVKYTGPVRWELNPDGSDAPILLFGEEEVRKSVIAWFEKHAGHDLHIEEYPPRSRRLASRIRPLAQISFDIDLIDAGEGLGQLLSVVTAIEMLRHRKPEKGPDLLVIEEPEAHLHKDLQRALMDELVEVTRTKPGGVTVLETHAETILLSLQLAVAEGKLSPNDVAIYWVNSESGRASAKRVGIGDDGWFEQNWPPSALGEDRELRAALQQQWDAKAGEQP